MERRDLFRAVGAGIGAAALGIPLTNCTTQPNPADPLGSLPFGMPDPIAGRDRWARIPSSFNRKVQRSTDAGTMNVLDGNLPADLGGHVLFQSISLLDSDTGFGGDSLVWRVDFDGAAPVIQSRLLETADYWMSKAFEETTWQFQSRGVTRIGPLGLQNQTNTTLVPVAGNRLLATVDAGRPWELDPATLRPVAPASELSNYRPMMEFQGFNQFVCPMTITSAHPPYDSETGELYHVSLSILPIPGVPFCEVLAYEPGGDIKRVPLVDGGGSPVHISQSAHQMCLTEEFLVIIDASATTEWNKLFEDPQSWKAGDFFTPRPNTICWVVRRDDIRATGGGAVTRKVVLPRESGHIFADYAAAPGRLVIHSAHTAALDVAEWIMPYDKHPVTGEAVREDLVGAAAPVGYDIGVVGRYEIDVRSETILEQSAFSNDWTWGTGGLTARNPLKPQTTQGDIFHANSGFMTDLAVQRMYDGFADYPHRLVELDELPWAGVPASLVRYDHDNGVVADGFFFPGDRMGWTPTFVPRNGTATGSTDGYIVSVVFSDIVSEDSSGPELWVFDAADLASGPLAKLGRADMEMPITLHSVWLDSLEIAAPERDVDVSNELQARADTWFLDPEVASTVRHEVLPAYESSRG